ncbi:MAG: hypothetical protein RLZZ347_726, partial [Candidatus Parcubacteria bacterium]
MPKQTIQDVTPPERRSIRNIPVSNTRRVFSRREDDAEEEVEVRRPRNSGSENHGHSRMILWGIAFLSLLGLATGLSAVFASTTFEVTPTIAPVSFDQDIVAYREAKGNTPSLLYTVMTVTREATASVPATGEEAVSKNATGKIIIYNKYTTASQRLIKNTRFETADGLVFRIKDAVVVPGAKKGGAELTPGSVEADVYADQPGEKYNIPLSDFTIPGFKGDPRYNAFYGRSKEAFTGGFVGTIKKVDPAVRAQAISDLNTKLAKEIDAEALAEKPDGFVLYDKAKFVTFTELPDATVDGKAVIGLRATLSGIIFDSKQLATTIAEGIVRGYAEEPVYSPDISKLNFFLNRDKVRLDTDKQVTFHLSGPVRIVYALDEVAFTKDVLGKSVGDLPAMLKKYP